MGSPPRRRAALPALLTILVASFGVVLGGAIAAGELLELAERPSGATGLDSSVTAWMVAHRSQGLTTLAKILSTLGSQAVLAPAAGVVLVALLWRRRLVPAAFLAAAWGGAIGLYSLTKHFVDRPRPPQRLWLTDVGRSSSFPSGHATQSLATFVALALVSAVWLPRTRRPALVVAGILAAGVGVSRIYLGVHWLTDVGAGWLIAAAWIAILAALARAAANRTPGVASRPGSRRSRRGPGARAG